MYFLFFLLLSLHAEVKHGSGSSDGNPTIKNTQDGNYSSSGSSDSGYNPSVSGGNRTPWITTPEKKEDTQTARQNPTYPVFTAPKADPLLDPFKLSQEQGNSSSTYGMDPKDSFGLITFSDGRKDKVENEVDPDDLLIGSAILKRRGEKTEKGKEPEYMNALTFANKFTGKMKTSIEALTSSPKDLYSKQYGSNDDKKKDDSKNMNDFEKGNKGGGEGGTGAGADGGEEAQGG